MKTIYIESHSDLKKIKYIRKTHQELKVVIVNNSVALEEIFENLKTKFFVKKLILEGFYNLKKPEKFTINKIDFVSQIEDLTIKNLYIADFYPLLKIENLKVLSLIDIGFDDLYKSFLVESYDFSFLKSLRNLEKLKIFNVGEYLENLNFLGNLLNLKQLGIIGDIINFTPINLKNLQVLRIVSSLEDLCFLKNLKNLKSLDLSKSNFSSLKCIEFLTSLEKLNLAMTFSQNYEDLAKAVNLKNLNLSYSSICSSKPLENLKALKSLGISETFICDFKFLQNLKELEELIIDNFDMVKPLKNISAIEKLKSLKNLLLLTANDYYNFDIEKLQNLESLYISRFYDYQKFGKLKKLQELLLDDCDIENLDFLYGLKNLKYLSISQDRPIKMTKKLKMAFPNLKVDIRNRP